MRSIEEKMLAALRFGKDWRSGNTSVSWCYDLPEGSQAAVRLHGNLIGIYRPASGSLVIRDGGGWLTVTTKSRLNALLELVPVRCGVSQYKGQWRFIRSDGSAEPWQGERTVEWSPESLSWNT